MVLLEWEMIADSNGPQDFLQWISIIKVAWEKMKVCLKSNVGEKGVSVVI